MLKSAFMLAGLSAASLFGAGAANAATINLDGFSCTSCLLVGSLSKATQVGTQEVLGNFVSLGALDFADDWMSFNVEPVTATGTVTVDLIGNPVFPGEQWQLVTGSVGGTVVVSPMTVTNTPTAETLTAGVTYFLELASSGAPDGAAASSATVTVPSTVPLPAALPLFASGLGLMGFWGRRRKQKAA